VTARVAVPMGRHARGRHRPATWGQTPAAAVLSRALEPEIALVWWISGHPEAVILPMIAGILTLAGFLVVAVVFAGAGVVVVLLVLWREAAWRRALAEEDTRPEGEVA
jgi:hypothetical protein